MSRSGRLSTGAIVLFFVLLVAYGLYEAQAMVLGPRITLPQETLTLQSPYTLVRGTAEHIVEIRLNGVPISVTEDGVFEEPYVLSEGENRLLFEAHDKYGRKTEETVVIMYLPGATVPLPPTTE